MDFETHDTAWQGQASYKDGLDGQTALIKISLAFGFTVVPQDKTYLNFSMQGTSVNPAQEGYLVHNSDEARGWYADQIDIYMVFSDQNSTTPNQRIKIKSDSPQTTSISATTTSDTSFSVGGSFSGGASPAAITGTYTVGKAISTSLPDFEVINNSSLYEVRHSYKLATTVGGPYNSPDDLLIKSAVKDFFVGESVKDPLSELPLLATHDFPVISQALWQADSNLKDNVDLTVIVTQYLKKVRTEAESKRMIGLLLLATGCTKVITEHKEWSYNVRFSIDFSSCKVSASPVETSYAWAD